jgi:short-subunit dehydrogenase
MIMKNQANNEVALITGASSGMGKDFSLRLLDEGYIVYGVARRIERMSDIEGAGGHIIKLDITDDSSIVATVDQIIKEQGRIDVLINNAGYGSYGAIEDVPVEEAKRQFEVNIFGLARLTQLVLPHMRKNNFGKIINISSIGGKLHGPLGGWYHATKFALEGLSDCLRFETKQFGIDVIIIEPGGVESEWGDIALNAAMERSGSTAYSETAKGFKKIMETFKKQAPPKVITDLVMKALRAKNPKTRYSAGTAAKPMLFMRKILSDRMFDKLFYLMMK